jgi:hypothetical protein
MPSSAAATPAAGTAVTAAAAAPATWSTGAPAAPACSAACWNVVGIGRSPICDGGQMIKNARPATSFSGTVPLAGKPENMCPRESSEMARLSPMTHSRPGGTTMLNDCIEGLAPWNR